MASASWRVRLCDAIRLIQWWQRINLHSKYIFLNVAWGSFELIGRVNVCGHRKDLVQFLQRQRFRLGEEQHDGKESKDAREMSNQ